MKMERQDDRGHSLGGKNTINLEEWSEFQLVEYREHLVSESLAKYLPSLSHHLTAQIFVKNAGS